MQHIWHQISQGQTILAAKNHMDRAFLARMIKWIEMIKHYIKYFYRQVSDGESNFGVKCQIDRAFLVPSISKYQMDKVDLAPHIEWIEHAWYQISNG